MSIKTTSFSATLFSGLAVFLALFIGPGMSVAGPCGLGVPTSWQDVYYVGTFPNHRCIVVAQHYNYLGVTGTSKSNSYAGIDSPSLNCTETRARAFTSGFSYGPIKTDTSFNGAYGPASFVGTYKYILRTDSWAVRPGLFSKYYATNVYC